MCLDALKNLNDIEKINYLIILIIKSSSLEDFKYGYNLITSSKIKISDVNNYINDLDNKSIDKKNEIKVKIKKIEEKNYPYICFKNIELSDQIYNYEYYKMNYPGNVDISLIKKFYKSILPLECFKSIFLALYGKDEYYPFQDKEFTDNFVNNDFEFIPMRLAEILGFSDKFTLKTYFISFLPEIRGKYNNTEKTVLKIGSLISTGSREIVNNLIFYG